MIDTTEFAPEQTHGVVFSTDYRLKFVNPPPHTPVAALSEFTPTNSPLSISNAAWLQHRKHWGSHRVQAVLGLGSHFQEKKKAKTCVT